MIKRRNLLLPFICGVGLAVAIATAPTSGNANDLVNFKVVDGNSIPASLTGKPGDPEKGRAVAIHRKKGNCLACHDMPVPEQPYHGQIGPDLAGIASRMTEGEIRLQIVNPKYANPDTIMPAFYRTEGLHRVAKKFQGKPMLTAEEVEDVVAYMMTLK